MASTTDWLASLTVTGCIQIRRPSSATSQLQPAGEGHLRLLILSAGHSPFPSPLPSSLTVLLLALGWCGGYLFFYTLYRCSCIFVCRLHLYMFYGASCLCLMCHGKYRPLVGLFDRDGAHPEPTLLICSDSVPPAASQGRPSAPILSAGPSSLPSPLLCRCAPVAVGPGQCVPIVLGPGGCVPVVVGFLSF